MNASSLIENIIGSDSNYLILATSVLTLVVNLFQSFKEGHFTSKCNYSNGQACCEVEHEGEDD